MKLSKGCVHVYTGDGKGKTTAALGLALRAAGQGLRVKIIQFMKKDAESGEFKAIQKSFKNISIVQAGRESFVNPKNPDPIDVKLAQAAIEMARNVMTSKESEVLILDEVNVAMSFGLVLEAEVLSLISEKPDDMELILTGRGATENLIERADLVTEMKEIKHYYSKGVSARDGIER